MILRKGKFALRAGFLFCLTIAANATPSINVEVRTSFKSPPFLIELLWVYNESLLLIIANRNAERRQQKKTQPPTSYSLTESLMATFDNASTEQELYTKFRTLLQQDGHLTQKEDLSSFDFALSIHSTAPRIEAHYQFYNTSISPSTGQGAWRYV